jgi:hypothetical protein
MFPIFLNGFGHVFWLRKLGRDAVSSREHLPKHDEQREFERAR